MMNNSISKRLLTMIFILFHSIYFYGENIETRQYIENECNKAVSNGLFCYMIHTLSGIDIPNLFYPREVKDEIISWYESNDEVITMDLIKDTELIYTHDYSLPKLFDDDSMHYLDKQIENIQKRLKYRNIYLRYGSASTPQNDSVVIAYFHSHLVALDSAFSGNDNELAVGHIESIQLSEKYVYFRFIVGCLSGFEWDPVDPILTRFGYCLIRDWIIYNSRYISQNQIDDCANLWKQFASLSPNERLEKSRNLKLYRNIEY